jgi:hypothetical protein
MKNEDSSWLFLVLIGAALLALSGKAVYEYMGRLSIQDLKTLAENIGFGADSSVAAAIAMAESSGDPNAYGDATQGGSYGLWQINAKYHPEFGPDFTALYDPHANANAAYLVYKQAGYSFQPWTTYKTGAYTAYLPDAQNA